LRYSSSSRCLEWALCKAIAGYCSHLDVRSLQLAICSCVSYEGAHLQMWFLLSALPLHVWGPASPHVGTAKHLADRSSH